uniref:Uncharacterized protein n=1 Tax=Branchiostoma floridae TaxID=7739 RepID=C3ZVU1_BRAFL|eukprot:XP_002587345.1 hypothetical protein BRAFLDRAFT_100543 [Branchiostoma floridae]
MPHGDFIPSTSTVLVRSDLDNLETLSDSEEPAIPVDTETTPSPSPERVIDQYFSQYVSRENMSNPTEEDDTVSTNTSVNIAMTTEPDRSWGEECGSPWIAACVRQQKKGITEEKEATC